MKTIIGIDLGTTNSLVAHHKNGKTTLITDRNGHKIIPSIVTVLDNETVIVGQRAKEMQQIEFRNSIYSSKRFIGQTINDINESELPPFIKPDKQGVLKAYINNKFYDLSDISATILNEIRKRANDYFNENIQSCVITVPAYFNDNQRIATSKAGQLAGFKVEKIINEPTAAALAYGLDKKENQIIAVYDLGGGTFDISILKLRDGIFDVLSTNGDTQLGGDDFDKAIINHIIQQIGIDKSELTLQQFEYLRNVAENAKIKLVNNDSLKLEITLEGLVSKEINFNSQLFDELIQPYLLRTKKSIMKAIKDADIELTDINEIIMVGGSTKSPIVQKFVQSLFNKKLHTDINPDEVVAIGAAIQASILEGNLKETVLIDVTPLSLGMETAGGLTEKFILRNTKIPCSVTQTFTTSKDNQTSVKINIVQGERELVDDNIKLNEFSLKNITPKPAGIPRIDVTFRLDSNGILHVSASDSSSGAIEEITIETMKNLSDEKVEDMLFTTLKFAKEDVEKRLLIDSRNEAKAIIHVTNSSLLNHSLLINDEEKKLVEGAIKELTETYVNETSAKVIMAKIDEFDAATEFFAERIMNSSIKKIIKNKKINDIV